ncbi:MAG: TIGR03617 family F420-dependent LLM class oxidoreductase [Porticoccaceae bacterium]
MKVVQRLKIDLKDVLADFDRKVELGYKSFSSIETKNNAFFAPLMCATRQRDANFYTALSVAFSRTPMLTATESYAINQYCRGRFTLGLGSQVKPHIERRFDMPWSGKPARQMREYINALHAIWDSCETGKPLDFQGETYRHGLLTPEFIPCNHGHGRPRVMLGAVGPYMTNVAADLADGLVTHSFTSETYLRRITLPAIKQRLEQRGKTRDDFEIMLSLFIVTGGNEEEFHENIAECRERIGFYASTPAYKTVLDSHGWGNVHEETKKLAREGRWHDIGAPIDDEILNTFAVVGEPEEIAPGIAARYGDVVDSIHCSLELNDEETQYGIIEAIAAIPSRSTQLST